MAEGQQNPISNHKSESTQHSHKTPYNAHTGRLEQIRRGNLLKRIAQPPINKNTDTSPAYIKHLKKAQDRLAIPYMARIVHAYKI
jgi:hypothetical protein